MMEEENFCPHSTLRIATTSSGVGKNDYLSKSQHTILVHVPIPFRQFHSSHVAPLGSIVHWE